MANINDFFYVGNGIAMAGMSYDSNAIYMSGGLWEEDTTLAGVVERVPTNSTVTLSVFPNPATNSITLSSANGPISILDPVGRSYIIPRSGNTFDVSSLPSGVYFVSDMINRTKFVKQ
jgi:type IX secretion system substrate protein